MAVLTQVRMTPQTVAVLRALLAAPIEGLYGLQIAQAVHLPTGTIFPTLGRLEHAGWITGTWEDREQAAAQGRRRRRYYQLTGPGRRAANEQLQDEERAWAARLGLGSAKP